MNLFEKLNLCGCSIYAFLPLQVKNCLFQKNNFGNLKKLQSIVIIFVFFIKSYVKAKNLSFLNNPPCSPISLEKIFHPHPYCQLRGSHPPPFIKGRSSNYALTTSWQTIVQPHRSYDVAFFLERMG